MALIKCKECGKKISDTVKYCPHCGYRINEDVKKSNIKEIVNSVKNVIKTNATFYKTKDGVEITAYKIIALVCIICSFISAQFSACFSREVYSLPDQTVSQILNSPLFDMEIFMSIIIFYVFFISVIAMIIYTFNNLKKSKTKLFFCITSTIYSMCVFILVFLSLIGRLKVFYPKGIVTYHVGWGGIYVLLLACLSSILILLNEKELIKNLMKNFNK